MGDLRKYRNKPVDCLVKSASGSERSQCKGPEVCLGNSTKVSVIGRACTRRGRVGDAVQRKEGPGASGPGGHWKYFGFYSEPCNKPVKATYSSQALGSSANGQDHTVTGRAQCEIRAPGSSVLSLDHTCPKSLPRLSSKGKTLKEENAV